MYDRLEFDTCLTGQATLHDEALLITVRIADSDFKHKAVYLSFREIIGAFLFNWILGREDQKWLFELESLASDCHLALLHGFEEGALNLGGSTIDFICEDKLGKDRPLFNCKLAGRRIIN